MTGQRPKASLFGSAWGVALRTVLLSAAVTLAVHPAQALEEKPFVKPVKENIPDGTAADFTAEKLTYDPRTKQAVATGRVVIVYGPYTLNASRVTYNENTGKFTANGSVKVVEPNGNILLAESTELMNRFKDGFAHHVKALLTNDAKLRARYATRKDGYLTVYQDSHYTVCEDPDPKRDNPVWELVADQTTHDHTTHTLYEVNPRLKIGGVTVGGLPYLEHADPSVKRRTGWLPPETSHNKGIGPAVVTPYFWAISPDKDLTFRPMWTAYQGPVADVEYRQNTGNGLYNIRGLGVRELSPSRTTENNKTRGAISSEGAFAINNDWSWGWNANLASDRTFLSDYDFEATDIVKNDIHATGLWDRDYVSAQALAFTPMGTTGFGGSLPTALPFITGENYFDDPVFGGDLSLAWSVYSIRRDVAGTPFQDVHHATSQSRAIADLKWQSQLVGDMGQLVTPFARLRSDVYVTNNLPDPTVAGGLREQETTTRVLPTAGVDMRLPMIASYGFGNSIFSPVFQVAGSLNEAQNNRISNEDAVTLNFDSSSLFLTDRFTGMDRYEGGVRSNLGMTYTFLGSNGGFVRASAGESFHIAGKNSFAAGSGLDGSASDLVGSVTFQPWDVLGLSYETRVEEDFSAINRQEALASLTFDRIAMQASYLSIAAEPRYGRVTDEEWAGTELRIGLSDDWYLFGGMRYDIANSNFAHKQIGVEFDCDCMNFKLAFTSDRDSDTSKEERSVMMSIDLATLGGTRSTVKF